jgi:hypothetical protein
MLREREIFQSMIIITIIIIIIIIIITVIIMGIESQFPYRAGNVFKS